MAHYHQCYAVTASLVTRGDRDEFYNQ